MGCCYLCSRETATNAPEIVKLVNQSPEWKHALCREFHRYYVFNQFEYFQIEEPPNF